MQGTGESTSCGRGEDWRPWQQGSGWAAHGPQATAPRSFSQALPCWVPASSSSLDFHKCGHICLTVQDVPQAASFCIPLCTARKCLHKSSPHRAKSVWTGLDQCTESPKFLINSSSSAPPRPPQRQGDFSQTFPKSAVFSGTSSAEAKEKKLEDQ